MGRLLRDHYRLPSPALSAPLMFGPGALYTARFTTGPTTRIRASLAPPPSQSTPIRAPNQVCDPDSPRLYRIRTSLP